MFLASNTQQSSVRGRFLFAPAPAPTEYWSEVEKYFFSLTPLLLHQFPTADILFRRIPPPSNPTDAYEFFSAEPPAANTKRYLCHHLAIVEYTGRHVKNPPTPPTLSPQYLHPPNETVQPRQKTMTTTTHHYAPRRTLTATSENSPANFDRDNPVP